MWATITERMLTEEKLQPLFRFFKEFFGLVMTWKATYKVLKSWRKEAFEGKILLYLWFRKWFLAKLRLCDEWSEFWH